MRVRAIFLGLLLCGCTGSKPDDEPAASTAAPAKTTATEAERTPEPTTEPQPTTPVEPFVPSTPVGPMTINAPAFECPPLPDSITGSTAEIARVLRQLACEPELFTLTAADLATKLALPTGVSVHFSDPGAVAVEIENMPPVLEVAAALGIDKPVARLQWNAYHDSWWLGSNPDTGELDRYRPGVINIQVFHEAESSDPPGKVVPLTAEMKIINGYVMVGMPDGVIVPGPDAEALTQLATAMRILAATPSMLAEAPEAVAERLKLTGERFLVERTSLHAAGAKIDGISIQPARTVIPADGLAEALGLVDARAASINREHDVWEIEVGSTTNIPWNGIVLEIDVNPVEKGDKTTTLAGATVEFISMMPPS
jgi:hypothetical protein